jgi:chemotaxis protein methyltransferase WspC
VFRVLSVPCSTGEEPYSLAMAFALAGWPLELLRIDAVDISRQNLERAARGIYGRNSFRGADLKFRTAFLEVAGNDTWRVSDRLRAPITFEFGNLLADDFAAARRRYDAIFCRNLLIYFDRATQARAVGMLDRLLAPEGWFAVGPAEPTLLFAHGYELVKVRSAFLLRRPTPGLPSPLPPLSKRPPAGPTPPVPWREVARPAPPEAVRPAADQAAADAEALSEIQQLADAGRLREARTRGEALLARRAASAPLLFLLGVVAEASGDTTRAEELFRKTIYLDPTHTEALGHLATRAELNGDRRAAHTFRERAQRALKKEAR